MMHGSGGQPTTWPWRDATQGNTHLIVGLAYGGQDDAGAQGIRSDPATCTAMIKYINDVRAAVDKDYGVDQSQVFLTGLSMGGWGVNFYGFKPEAKGLYRGYCIMAAGPRNDSGVDLSVAKGLPLLLVNGETDPNKRAADEGKPAAEKAGIIVEYKILPGEGHVPRPTSSPPPSRHGSRPTAPSRKSRSGSPTRRNSRPTGRVKRSPSTKRPAPSLPRTPSSSRPANAQRS